MVPAFTANEIRKAIFDFYILSKGVPPEFNDDGSLRNYRTDLLNAWRRTLLRDVEFCLACELRHTFDGTASVIPAGMAWVDWFGKHFGEIGRVWENRYRAVVHGKLGGVPMSADPSFNEDVATIYKKHTASGTQKPGSRVRSYLGAKAAEVTLGLSLLEVADVAFNPANVTWGPSYGGPKWRTVASTMLALLHATDAAEIVHLIDTAFALQHNTAIVFNKNALWAGPNNYVWLMEALDMKWVASSPASLLGFATDRLQEIVRDLGFRCNKEVPISSYKFKPQVGKQMTVMLDGKEVTVKIKNLAGTFYRSAVVSSNEFSLHKQIGKYAKEIDTKVFLWEDLMAIATGWETTPTAPPKKSAPTYEPAYAALASGLATLADKKSDMESSLHAKYKTDAAYLAFKAALSSAYEAFESHVGSLGFSLGSFLEKGYTIRFRVIGAPKPCRFYFVFDSGTKKIEMHVGHTEENNLLAAPQVSTFNKPDTAKILERLLKHLKPALES